MEIHVKFSAIMLGFFCIINLVRTTPNTNVTNVLCNSGVYTGGDPFVTSLAYVLEELETKTSSTDNYNYFNISPYPNAFAYGHASCNRNLTSSDCTTCLGAAKTTMLGTCQSRIGARAVLRDCGIRYEQYPFTE
ncbi:antifungal protein ginkbilobin-like protein [Ziziphus jujuba]|uniref:Antifungal protein ginkbilobin-like protein n=1 Tax=Ziziphus jujuba TaxID=326968 RepID=A0ABM3IVS7_ZIZJJ|nr:antifungal protein ginkbilobin-like protein [Ziziphus jujuba]